MLLLLYYLVTSLHPYFHKFMRQHRKNLFIFQYKKQNKKTNSVFTLVKIFGQKG